MHIPQVMQTKQFQLTMTAALSGLAGVAGGYILAAKKLESVYAQQAQDDINEMKEHYASEGFEKVRKEGVYSTPASTLQTVREDRYDEKELEALAAYVEELTPYQGAVNETYVEDPPTIDITEEQNVWQNDDPETYFDWEEELERRKTASIFVITSDEFLNNESGFGQDTITYFEGDETLADSRDQIIHKVDDLCGETNLYRFGHGSGDKSVVYVRNVDKQLELEILLSDGKFSEEVLGFSHSDDYGPKIRKFRGGLE